MENSNIEWTDHTANIWIGCEEVHDGCDNCYARTLNHRWGHDNWGKSPRRAVKKVLDDLRRWQKNAAKAGRTDTVFVGSMMDIFEKSMPLAESIQVGCVITDQTYMLRSYFFEVVVPASPNLRFLLLTKRPSNINKMIPGKWLTNPPSNVYFGCSISDQKTADRLIPQLKQVNGNHFLSIEPQLSGIELHSHIWDTCTFCNGTGMEKGTLFPCFICLSTKYTLSSFRPWIIVGGESGPKRRPYNLDWAKSLQYECFKSGLPFFFKQIDKVQPIPDYLKIRQFPWNQ